MVATAQKTFEDLDPYTGDVVAEVPAGGAEEARQAVEAAAAAFPAWAESLPAERQRIFLKAAAVLEGRGDEVVGLPARRRGGRFAFAMFQLEFSPGLLAQAAASATAPTGAAIP